MILHESPLRKLHERYVEMLRTPVEASRPGAASGHQAQAYELEMLPYAAAPATTSDDSGDGGRGCELVGTYGAVELEYAALRRSAGLVDCPHRVVLEIRGSERFDFLNRMVTQELRGLDEGGARATFWLNRKGRVEADLLLIQPPGGDALLAVVDLLRADAARTTLDAFLFAEDVEIVDRTDAFHVMQAHGPAAVNVVEVAAGDLVRLAPGGAATTSIGGVSTTVARHDEIGDPGVTIIAPREQSPEVWAALLETTVDGERPLARPSGWYAFNIARIEAGTPLFNVDFGVTNLPHETGLLHARVSFTKGCYLGQEVVARMDSLGRPKQMLIGLRPKADRLPVAGGQVFARPTDESSGGMGPQVGAVTSSTLAPMLGSVPIAFAMVKTAHAEEGNTLIVNAEGEQVEADVAPLTFWRRKDDE